MLYQPRCIVAFDAQQKHNISSFFNFASVILKIFRFFFQTGKLSKTYIPQKSDVISALLHRRIRRATENIIYQRFLTLQADFYFFFDFFGFFWRNPGGSGQNSGDKTGGWLALCRVPRGAKRGTEWNGEVQRERREKRLECCDKAVSP